MLCSTTCRFIAFSPPLLAFFIFLFFLFFQKSPPLSQTASFGLVVKTPASRAADLGSNPAFAVDRFLGRVIPLTEELALQWLPCQAPGVMGRAGGTRR